MIIMRQIQTKFNKSLFTIKKKQNLKMAKYRLKNNLLQISLLKKKKN